MLAYIPDIDGGAGGAPGCAPRTLERPWRLTRSSSCDLLVCHGGEIAGGALARRAAADPPHYEQYLTARCIDALGAGGRLTPATPADVRVATPR